MSNEIKTPCVYKITCKVNNKVYVGSTNNFHRRHLEHIQTLNRNCHENKRLQHDWDLYNNDDFEFSVIEELSEENYINKSVRFSRENYWIETLSAQYNISDAFGSKPISEEQKLMVSKVHSGKKFSQEQKDLYSNLFSGVKNPRAKTLYQYNSYGEYVRKYDFVKAVTIENPEFKHNVIIDIVNLKDSSGNFVNERKLYKGFLWSYLPPIDNHIPPLEDEPKYKKS